MTTENMKERKIQILQKINESNLCAVTLGSESGQNTQTFYHTSNIQINNIYKQCSGRVE